MPALDVALAHQRAAGLAASAQATGRAGYASQLERGAAAAANDEDSR
jgi:hypothetical protein